MITVIGSSNIDLVIKVPRIPSVGETVLGGSYFQMFGGKGANQAIAAKRSGGEVLFITKVGTDDHGKSLIKHFRSEGLAPEGLLEDAFAPTGVAQIWVSEKGENSIVVASGSNMNLLPEDCSGFYDSLARSEIILMQLEIPVETVEQVSEWVSQHGKKVILNPAPASPLPEQLLRNVWLLTPNETEAEILCGISIQSLADAERAGAILVKMGVTHVVITMGSKGCLWCEGSSSVFFPAFKMEAIDTTAAGDVFNGALAVALHNNKTMEEAIHFASAAAAISVTRIGAQSSIPFQDEIDLFLKNI